MHYTLRFITLFLFISTLLIGCGDKSPDTTNKKEFKETTANKTSSRLALGTPGYWVPSPDEGVELGLGWDSREGRVVVNRCVRIAPVRSTGQTSTLKLDQVSDRSDVMKAMSMSAAASVKTMFASASGSASFAKSTKVSSQSTTLLLNATVTNGTIFAGPADAAAPARTAFPAVGQGGGKVTTNKQHGRLTFEPWAMELMKRPKEFRAYCGDGFVSAINSGARLLATYTFSAKSKAEQQSAAAKLKVQYGPANASGSASSKSRTDTSKVETHVRYMQVGGAKGAIATTPEALIDKLKVLAAEADESPRFQDMRITPYAQLGEWRGNDDWRDTDDEYEVIAETYWQLTSLEEDVAYILDNYSEYNAKTGMSKVELIQFLEDILTLRRAIYSALSNEDADKQNAVAEAKAISLFKASKPQNKLMVPRSIDVSAINDNATLGELANNLKKALPFNNATLLRINLPVPTSETPAKANGKPYTASELQNAVINLYIKQDAKIACQRDPTDNGCLSRKELASIAQWVPVRQ